MYSGQPSELAPPDFPRDELGHVIFPPESNDHVGPSHYFSTPEQEQQEPDFPTAPPQRMVVIHPEYRPQPMESHRISYQLSEMKEPPVVPPGGASYRVVQENQPQPKPNVNHRRSLAPSLCEAISGVCQDMCCPTHSSSSGNTHGDTTRINKRPTPTTHVNVNTTQPNYHTDNVSKQPSCFPDMPSPSFVPMSQEQMAVYLGVSISCLALIFGIYFGSVDPNLEARKNYIQTSCMTDIFSDTPYRCCDILDCSCSTCSLSLSCNNLVTQGFNSSQCCGSSCCAQTCYETCYETCYRTCYDTCTRTICPTKYTCFSQSYDCNPHDCQPYDCRPYNCRPYCCNTIPSKTCQFACGTCHAYHLVFHTAYRSDLSLHDDQNCERDDVSCQLQKTQTYNSNSSWPCWVDKRDPTSIRFSGVPSLNIAAIFFFAFFLMILFVLVIYILVQHVKCWK